MRTITIVTTALLGAAFASGGNMLLNPGFEFPDLPPGQTQAPGADDWDTFNTAGVRTAFANSGDQSLRLAPNAPTGTAHGIARQEFPAAANDVFSIGAWVFHPSSAPVTGTRKAQLRIQWLNSNNALINQSILDVLDANSVVDQWSFVSLENVVLPNNPNIASIRASLFVVNAGGTGGGAVFWDDAVLVNGPVVPEPASLLLLSLGGVALLRRR